MGNKSNLWFSVISVCLLTPDACLINLYEVTSNLQNVSCVESKFKCPYIDLVSSSMLDVFLCKYWCHHFLLNNRLTQGTCNCHYDRWIYIQRAQMLRFLQPEKSAALLLCEKIIIIQSLSSSFRSLWCFSIIFILSQNWIIIICMLCFVLYLQAWTYNVSYFTEDAACSLNSFYYQFS